jgi:hypothetical protein
MPTNHVSIQDSKSILPNGIDNDFTKTFDAPGLNTATRPYLSYRVLPVGGAVTLQMDLNGDNVVDETFQTGVARTLNEIVDNGIALETGNQLVVRRQAGPGTLEVQDFIFTYSQDA